MSVPENGGIWNSLCYIILLHENISETFFGTHNFTKNVTCKEFSFIVSPRSAALPRECPALPRNFRETCSRPKQE